MHVKQIHHKVKCFSCTLCDKSFSSKQNLLIHIDAVHKNLKPFTCTLCDKSFSRKGGLSEHVAAVHDKLTTFSCTLCDKSFTQKASLIEHIHAIHHKCVLCNKLYGSTAELVKHIGAVHNELKLFSCTLCDKSFAYKFELTVHVNRFHHTINLGVNTSSIFTLNDGTSLGTSDLHSAAQENMYPSQNDQSLSEKSPPTQEIDDSQDASILKCSQCAAQFYMKETLEKHAAIHTQN